MLLLRPLGKSRPPVVVGVSQHGKAAFVSARADEVRALLAGGIAVCLPDLRGTGETSFDSARSYNSASTSLSATEWMFGKTSLGARLRDLRSVLRYLRTRTDLEASGVALWGDSFAPTNPPGFTDALLGEGPQPHMSEPLGGLLALLGALFEDEVRAVIARGTLAGYRAVLRDRYCYVPHDALVPGALTLGDLDEVAAALAPQPLRLEALVDGRNVVVGEREARERFAITLRAYASSPDRLQFAPTRPDDLAAWLRRALSDQRHTE